MIIENVKSYEVWGCLCMGDPQWKAERGKINKNCYLNLDNKEVFNWLHGSSNY